MKTTSHIFSQRMMALRLLSEGLDARLERLLRSGAIATWKDAGPGRTALIGAGLALEERDMLFGTRRDLCAAVARGVSLDEVFLQVLGRAGDPGLGRALPGAFRSSDKRVMLADGNVAAHTMHAAGFGHAARLRGDKVLSVALFGGAAQANGELHGALNFAAVYRAQTVFLCRGLQGDEVPFVEAQEAWGLPCVSVDGHDGEAVYKALKVARERALAGEGPTLIDARVSSAAQVSVDAARAQAEGVWSTEDQGKVRAEVSEALRLAKHRAEAALPVPDTSLTEAVFQERPWFL